MLATIRVDIETTMSLVCLISLKSLITRMLLFGADFLACFCPSCFCERQYFKQYIMIEIIAIMIEEIAIMIEDIAIMIEVSISRQ
jgi:hypothetical protein